MKSPSETQDRFHGSQCDPTQTIGESLQAAALSSDAGLLVMGGYAHSRTQEFILGGATRSILKHQRLPVLPSGRLSLAKGSSSTSVFRHGGRPWTIDGAFMTEDRMGRAK